MAKQKIKILDTTQRDGSHAVSHSFSVEQISAISGALDKVGVSVIEVSHGDGLAGESINYGFLKEATEEELIRAARANIKNAMLGILCLPGIATIEHLDEAKEMGAQMARIAAHCTEVDIAIQHVSHCAKIGIMPAGFLMMSHMTDTATLLEQAKIYQDAGAQYINIGDSAGYMTPNEVREKVSALKNGLEVEIGFHAHNNLGLAVANALAAAQEGATYIDVTCRGLGAGAGNAQAEVTCAVLEREGFDTGVDIFGLMDVAEEIVEPLMPRPQIVNTASLMLGYAGVYSSFLLHTYRAAEKFNISPREILVELGRRRMVGGQEDMIVDVAYELSQSKK